MVEVFAGAAVLCATAKQHGLETSLAVDKNKKKTARCAILQLDLTVPCNQDLLTQWIQSPLLLWLHLAPVCGTASRARDIRRFPGDPKPLRSNEFPEGLPSLNEQDSKRVFLANQLFEYACKLFADAAALGIVVTMENPRSSYFWLTCWFLALAKQWQLFRGDFQACMLGSGRDKWSRFVCNAQFIEALNIPCDGKHQHLPWGFALNDEGNQVWATSLESQYPRKLCVTVVSLVLQFAEQRGLILKAFDLQSASENPMRTAQFSRIAAGTQPKPSRVPPIVPDFSSAAVFLVKYPTEIPCTLMSKLQNPLQLHTVTGAPVVVPKFARFLRLTARPSPVLGEDQGVKGRPCKRIKSDANSKDSEQPTQLQDVGPPDPLTDPLSQFGYEVAFGLPWDYEGFIQKACETGHPAAKYSSVPWELSKAIEQQSLWSAEQLANYRIAWCRKWLKRCKELAADEEVDRNSNRSPHVAAATEGKRILLTQEILSDIGYEDMSALDLLRSGATLAGEVPKCPVFPRQFKPCLLTMEQLVETSQKRNQMILNMTVTSGSPELDVKILEETKEELIKGWIEGPFDVDALEPHACISRRFGLVQGSKTRMIDDFSISGINDTCVIHNKIDLHMIDTFAGAIRMYFQTRSSYNLDTCLEAKTYDLKAAYRQVPIKEEHLKFAYFSVYNCELRRVEVYRLKTLPFGATHSVYNFLRLSRMLYAIATRALYLLTTNFYDDFLLASAPELKESSSSSMELLFMLTGWQYDRAGKKATEFSTLCKALGVCFDLSACKDQVLKIDNTAARKEELVEQLQLCVCKGSLGKQETLVLRGRLGFADSFIHGRLGSVTLKQLSEHAYGHTAKLDAELKLSLEVMSQRLRADEPRLVTAGVDRQMFIFTDAAYEPETKTGGLGAVICDEHASVVGWFGIQLDTEQCVAFGANLKDSIIYELELLAAVIALAAWCKNGFGYLHTWFGDNDSVRFALIRGTANGHIAQSLLSFYMKREVLQSAMVWFARVPTEANISDFPSRRQEHPLLSAELNRNDLAQPILQAILNELKAVGRQCHLGEA